MPPPSSSLSPTDGAGGAGDGGHNSPDTSVSSGNNNNNNLGLTGGGVSSGLTSPVAGAGGDSNGTPGPVGANAGDAASNGGAGDASSAAVSPIGAASPPTSAGAGGTSAANLNFSASSLVGNLLEVFQFSVCKMLLSPSAGRLLSPFFRRWRRVLHPGRLLLRRPRGDGPGDRPAPGRVRPGAAGRPHLLP